MLALVMTFLGEYGIMKLLPLLIPSGNSDSLEAVMDAFLLTLLLAPIFWIVAVRPMNRLADSRMRLLRRTLTVQEDERRRITQDLHDGFGQSLTSLMLGLRALEETASEQPIRELAQRLRGIGSDVYEELRRIMQGLRPIILDKLGLAAAIERLIADTNYSDDLKIEFQSSGLKDRNLLEELESTAFRIIQEALNNAIRHSSASLVRISIDVQDQCLNLQIQDNGHGFDTRRMRDSAEHSYGLLGIRERATLYGGTVTIQSSPKTGSLVFVRLPLDPGNTPDA
ncbi:MAG: sensor histidine kinase [Planctomycetaceae bacterium]|nr:sensor histidine kinase [Planctomycetaceae bacterium]